MAGNRTRSSFRRLYPFGVIHIMQVVRLHPWRFITPISNFCIYSIILYIRNQVKLFFSSIKKSNNQVGLRNSYLALIALARRLRFTALTNLVLFEPLFGAIPFRLPYADLLKLAIPPPLAFTAEKLAPLPPIIVTTFHDLNAFLTASCILQRFAVCS